VLGLAVTGCNSPSGGGGPEETPGMVWIDGGTFTMGSEDSQDFGASPSHTVTLSGFYMGEYEVTQEKYLEVMGTNPSYFTINNGREPETGEADIKRPVERVSWYDALVFCNKLSMIEGLSPAYKISGSTDPAQWGPVPSGAVDPVWDAVEIAANSTGYRLPTEAQWEYACRAGTTSPWYCAETGVGDYAWYNDNSGSKTHEVGKKLPNAYELYDMHGNVLEWCWDWYASYPAVAQNDPVGASSGFLRVPRGGSYLDSAQDTRSASRSLIAPFNRLKDQGFRLVRLSN
jgi:formylglycine-generating enzyme required for sulfatase activity